MVEVVGTEPTVYVQTASDWKRCEVLRTVRWDIIHDSQALQDVSQRRWGDGRRKDDELLSLVYLYVFLQEDSLWAASSVVSEFIQYDVHSVPEVRFQRTINDYQTLKNWAILLQPFLLLWPEFLNHEKCVLITQTSKSASSLNVREILRNIFLDKLRSKMETPPQIRIFMLIHPVVCVVLHTKTKIALPFQR